MKRHGKCGAWRAAATVVLANALVVSGLHQVAGVRLWPAWGGDPSPTPPAVEVQAVARHTDPTPAQRVIEQVLATTPTAVKGRRWQEHTQVDAAGFPTAVTCGRPSGPGAVVARARSWSQVSGPLPRQLSRSITVSLHAYSAGAGAVAFDRLVETVSRCPGAWYGYRGDLGVEAISVGAPVVGAVVWRLGDVVAVVAGQTRNQAMPVSELAQPAREIDQRLQVALAEVCVDVEATSEQASRSPLVDRGHYTGLRVPRTVTLPSPAATQDSSGVSPSVSPVPIPAPEIPLPEVTLPHRPADPVTPSTLPSPVPRPTPPAAPSPAPTATTVTEQIEDTAGPGCGWAFTGQATPRFDAVQAAREFAEARKAALEKLERQWQQWEQAKQEYYVAYADYVKQAEAYQRYAQQVKEVAAAWREIQQERDAYEQVLRAYEAAVEAREKFLAEQAEAQRVWREALQACQATPTPSPAPTPAASPSPTSPAPAVSPSATPPVTCPPERPSILDQTPPPVPTKPTPPAPRP